MHRSGKSDRRKGPPAPWRGSGGGDRGLAAASKGIITAAALAEALAARLQAAGPDARGYWRARCPFHDDQNPSFFFDDVWARCWACNPDGMPLRAVAARLGLDGGAHDERRNGHQPARRQAQQPADPLAWWAERCGVPRPWLEKLPIEARDGAVAFVWPGLDVAKLRSPEAKGYWAGDGPRPPLWPALAEAMPAVLVLTEGESDVTVALYALEAAGLAGQVSAHAVTKGAAAKPEVAVLRELVAKGARALLLIPDADEAGRRFATAWREAAQAVGMACAVLDLVARELVSPGLGEKDLRDAFRRQAVKVTAALKEAVHELGEAAGRISFLPSIEGERGRKETGPWQPLPLGEAPEGAAVEWLWEGFIARGMATDLYGLWKAGKSTLLGCLLREMATGGELAGRPVAQGRALVIAEESAAKWERRAAAMAIPHGAHDVIARPFKRQATWEDWESFVGHVAALVREREYALVIFDSLPNLWPVRKENEAGEALQALRPLVAVLEAGAAVLLVRHPRKSDGEEATAGRGSGAIDGFVDVIVEFRRYRPEDKEDSRRVFSVYSREEPFEIVAEFDGATYVALGGKAEVRREERLQALLSLLPTEPPGLTAEEVHGAWPDQPRPGVNVIRDDLAHLLARGLVARTGEGKRGDPYRWHRPGGDGPGNSFLPRSLPIEGRKETSPEGSPQAEGDGAAPPPPGPAEAPGAAPSRAEDGGAGGLPEAQEGPAPRRHAPAWAIQVLEELEAGAPPFEPEEGPPHPAHGCPLCQPAPWPWWSMGYRACRGADGPVLIRSITDPGRHLLQHALGEPAVAVAEALLRQVYPAWLVVEVKGYGWGWLSLRERPGQQVDYGEPQRAWRLSEFTWEGRQLPMQWGPEFPDTGGEFPNAVSEQATPQEFPNRGAEFPNAGREFPNGVSERPGGVSEHRVSEHTRGVSEHRVSEQAVSEQPGGVSEQGRCLGCGRPLPRRPTGRPPGGVATLAACGRPGGRRGEALPPLPLRRGALREMAGGRPAAGLGRAGLPPLRLQGAPARREAYPGEGRPPEDRQTCLPPRRPAPPLPRRAIGGQEIAKGEFNLRSFVARCAAVSGGQPIEIAGSLPFQGRPHAGAFRAQLGPI